MREKNKPLKVIIEGGVVHTLLTDHVFADLNYCDDFNNLVKWVSRDNDIVAHANVGVYKERNIVFLSKQDDNGMYHNYTLVIPNELKLNFIKSLPEFGKLVISDDNTFQVYDSTLIVNDEIYQDINSVDMKKVLTQFMINIINSAELLNNSISSANKFINIKEINKKKIEKEYVINITE